MLLHVIYKFKINTRTNTHILSYTNKIQSPVPGYVRMSPCQSVPLLRVPVLVLVHFLRTLYKFLILDGCNVLCIKITFSF